LAAVALALAAGLAGRSQRLELSPEALQAGLADLSAALGRDLSLRNLDAANAVEPVLRWRRATLAQLPQLAGPLLAVENRGAALYQQRDGAEVQRQVAGGLQVVPWRTLRRRYTGWVLTADGAETGGLRLKPLVARLTAAADGSPVVTGFVIENRGSEPVSLTLRSKSCDCTSVTIVDPVVAPGAGGAVQVSATPSGPGTSSYRVVLDTTCPAWPRLTLLVELTAPQPVTLYPSALYLSASGPAPASATARLTAPLGSTLGDIATSATWLDCEVRAEPGTLGVAAWQVVLRGSASEVGERHAEARFTVVSGRSRTVARLPVVLRRFGR
jgi:hypothetical protein